MSRMIIVDFPVKDPGRMREALIARLSDRSSQVSELGLNQIPPNALASLLTNALDKPWCRVTKLHFGRLPSPWMERNLKSLALSFTQAGCNLTELVLEDLPSDQIYLLSDILEHPNNHLLALRIPLGYLDSSLLKSLNHQNCRLKSLAVYKSIGLVDYYIPSSLPGIIELTKALKIPDSQLVTLDLFNYDLSVEEWEVLVHGIRHSELQTIKLERCYIPSVDIVKEIALCFQTQGNQIQSTALWLSVEEPHQISFLLDGFLSPHCRVVDWSLGARSVDHFALTSGAILSPSWKIRRLSFNFDLASLENAVAFARAVRRSCVIFLRSLGSVRSDLEWLNNFITAFNGTWFSVMVTLLSLPVVPRLGEKEECLVRMLPIGDLTIQIAETLGWPIHNMVVPQ